MSISNPNPSAHEKPIPPIGRAFMRGASALHVFLYRMSGGVIGGKMGAGRVVLLTTKGNKTGKPRTIPLLSLEDGGHQILIASMGGAPSDPAWFNNLKKNPVAELQIGSETKQYRAEEVTGLEYDRLWKKIVAMNPGYDGYKKKTSRHIPVIAMKPIS